MATHKEIKMKNVIIILILALVIVGCGGQATQAPIKAPVVNNTTSIPSWICKNCPPPIATQPGMNTYFNSLMIGQIWTFQDSAGRLTFYNLKQVPPSNYYPNGSINMNITKNDPNTYWLIGVPDASIDFILTPMADSSYQSLGWVLYFPTTVPSWLPCHASPCSEEAQPPAGSATPYLIVPPASLKLNQPLTTETSYNRWDSTGINLDSFISGAPSAKVYWKTIFSLRSDGYAVSEQWEGDCGHEVWYFKAGLGLVRVESPNDGHGVVGVTCPGNDPSTTINRIS